jgi:hypothetical protein
MNKFKFKINEAFFMQENMIGMVGEMFPKDTPLASQQYYEMKLMQGDKVLHCFENIDEEMPRRLPGTKIVRAIRTYDDIKDLLTNNDLKTLYILGKKREDSKKDDSTHKKEGMTTWQKRFNK